MFTICYFEIGQHKHTTVAELYITFKKCKEDILKSASKSIRFSNDFILIFFKGEKLVGNILFEGLLNRSFESNWHFVKLYWCFHSHGGRFYESLDLRCLFYTTKQRRTKWNVKKVRQPVKVQPFWPFFQE